MSVIVNSNGSLLFTGEKSTEAKAEQVLEEMKM